MAVLGGGSGLGWTSLCKTGWASGRMRAAGWLAGVMVARVDDDPYVCSVHP